MRTRSVSLSLLVILTGLACVGQAQKPDSSPQQLTSNAGYNYGYTLVAQPGDTIDSRLIGVIWAFALSDSGSIAFMATLDTAGSDPNHQGLFLNRKLIAEEGKPFKGKPISHLALIGIDQKGVAFFSGLTISSETNRPVSTIMGSDGTILYVSDRSIGACKPTFSDPTNAPGSLVFSPVKSDIVFTQGTTCREVQYFTSTAPTDIGLYKTVSNFKVQFINGVRYQDRIYYLAQPRSDDIGGFVVSDGQIVRKTPEKFTSWDVSAKGNVYFVTDEGITQNGTLVIPHHQTIGKVKISQVARPVETDTGTIFMGADLAGSVGFFTKEGPILTEGQVLLHDRNGYIVHFLGAGPPLFPRIFGANTRGQLLLTIDSRPFTSILVLASRAGSILESPVSACKPCADIAKQYVDPRDKQESIELCTILMGALKELGDYRSVFLKKPSFINLFPTVYYNTTKIEMQRLAAGTFQYPIEKMQQMLCFFDAYKSNRSRWDSGQSTEAHWRKHFEAAVLADRRLAAYATINLTSLETVGELQHALNTAITAHVQYDLPRALWSSFHARFHVSLTVPILQPDFFKTDVTLRASATLGRDDIYAAANNSPIWSRLLLVPSFLREADDVFQETEGTIDTRRAAWHTAFYGVLPTGASPQPETPHDTLQREGNVSCTQ